MSRKMRSKEQEKALRDAIWRIVEEAQSPEGYYLHLVREKDKSFRAWSVNFIAGTLRVMKRTVTHPVFIVACGLALISYIMLKTGISIVILRHGDIILKII